MRYQPDVCPVCRNVFLENDIPAICPQCRANLSQLWLIVEEAEDCLDSASRNLLLGQYQQSIELAIKAKSLSPQVISHANDIIIQALIEQKNVSEARELLKTFDEESPLLVKYHTQIEQLYENELLAKQHYNAGLGFARRDKLVAARDELLNACKYAPWLPEPHITLTKVYMLLEQFQFAAQELEYLKENNPELSEISELYPIVKDRIPCVNSPSREETEGKYNKSIIAQYNKNNFF